MNMRKRSIKRIKALLGLDGAAAGAAIIAAAGINVAGQMAAAKEQSKATIDSARSAADATIRNADIEAASIKAQTDNNRLMQEKAMELSKELHKEQQDRQKDIQMTLQMMAGQETTADRKRSSMQVAKYGGRKSVKNTLRNAGNADFEITDGGKVQFKGYTPEGFELYKFVGDTHNQSHKLPNGKRATGIGVDLKQFKYGGNADIEAEGGEYALAVPNNVLFISKHNINGFNPSKAIEHGVNPLDAFNMQELKKQNMSKRKFRLVGGTSNILMDGVLLNGADNITTDDVVNGAGTRTLKYGGKAKSRHCFKGGGIYPYANLIGAGAGVLGNMLSYNYIREANNEASDILSRAYGKYADTMEQAYDSMTGIDMSNLKKEDYAATHYLPAVRGYQVSAAPQTTMINRSADVQRKAVNKRTLSSAAALNRNAAIESDRVSKNAIAYNEAEKQSQAIKAENMKAINEAAEKNAILDTQAAQEYNDAKLDLLRYNNDIENAKIAGKASARGAAITQTASTDASTRQANAQSLANAIGNSTNLISGTLNNMATRYYDTKNALLGADEDTRIQYLIENGSDREITQKAEMYKSLAENEPNEKLRAIYERRYNLLSRNTNVGRVKANINM